jgi:hypothetical protein
MESVRDSPREARGIAAGRWNATQLDATANTTNARRTIAISLTTEKKTI